MKNQHQIVESSEASIVPPSSDPKAASGRLIGKVQRPAELTPTQRDHMFALLVHYFNNINRPQFEHDLAEKEWVITLTDAISGQIQGFSTLMQLRVVVNDQPVVAFFSGDTIIHQDYWGETELPRLWGQHVFGLAKDIHDAQVYWFLISSGYKTYRFLPVFFCEFYPTYKSPTPPAIKQVLDALGQLKFPDEYSAESGLIHFTQASPLRSGVAEVTQRRLKDPHVAFFINRNPGHTRGDQLACLVKLSYDNLTPAGRRLMEKD